MIITFADEETRKILGEIASRKLPPEIQRTARRKLLYLNNALDLRDLLIPPGNQLEVLKGSRKGQHSIRINAQWRICFTWKITPLSEEEAERENVAQSGGNAYEVEIIDYH